MENPITFRLRSEIFQKLAPEYIKDVRAITRAGLLTSGDQWDNVVEHSLVQAEAHKVLANLLSLPKKEGEQLVKSALYADWNQRLNKRPQDFNPQALEVTQRIIQEADLNQDLVRSTEPGFHNEILNGSASLLQKLVFYIDDIARGSDIVSLEERIQEVEQRRPDLGKEFWDRERRSGKLVERELFTLLREKGVNIEEPEDIPTLLGREVEKKMQSYAPYKPHNKKEKKA